jgi:enoyl-CoA hydratase
MGQRLMLAVDDFPAPVYAAIYGYCMGGGLDLALACDVRIAHPHAVFGHRGAALGLITGWGGTQRLPRLVGKAKGLEMFVAAEKLTAAKALDIGLVSRVDEDPVQSCLRTVRMHSLPNSQETG